MIIKTGENKATVLLYGVIGDEVTALDLRNQLSENGLGPESELEVHIHSPGGSVFEGVAIVAALKDYNTVAVIDGLAASMASVIALACDEVEIADGAQIMVHNPWTFAFGDANELRKEAALLDQIRDDIIDTFEGTGKTAGKDHESGKLTYMEMMSKEQAEAAADKHTQRAIDLVERIGQNGNLLKKLASLLLKRTT